MGGCCCSSRKAQLQGTPVYYYCPPALEQQGTLRPYPGPAAGLLVGLNLDTSSPDTYQPPPPPIPFNVLFGCPQTSLSTLGSQGRKGDASGQPTESGPIIETSNASPVHLSKTGSVTLADILLASPTKSEIEPPKSLKADEPASEEEDACPICLEEYNAENPKMFTNCEHEFHLSCLLEWMERSDSCPVCDKEMIFDPPND